MGLYGKANDTKITYAIYKDFSPINKKYISNTIVQVSIYDILVSWFFCRMYPFAHKSRLHRTDREVTYLVLLTSLALCDTTKSVIIARLRSE